MKYLVTVVRTDRFTIEVSAKDSDMAIEKATNSWNKLKPSEYDHADLGKFEYQEEEIEFEADEL